MMRPIHQITYCLGRPLCVDLDSAVGHVPNPSQDPQIPGLAAARIAEIDPLYPTVNDQVLRELIHAPILTHAPSGEQLTPRVAGSSLSVRSEERRVGIVT